MGRIGKDAKDVIPSLLSALSDKDLNVRAAAAEALGRIGNQIENTREIVTVLTTIFNNRNEEFSTRYNAIESLKKIHSPEVGLVLTKYQVLVNYITWTDSLPDSIPLADKVSKASDVKLAALNFANKNQPKVCDNNLAKILLGWKCNGK